MSCDLLLYLGENDNGAFPNRETKGKCWIRIFKECHNRLVGVKKDRTTIELSDSSACFPGPGCGCLKSSELVWKKDKWKQLQLSGVCVCVRKIYCSALSSLNNSLK